MRFHNSTAELFIPDDLAETGALSRVTHLGIGAHQDDLEFMAFQGIIECYQNDSRWFAGVTCTNGAGSSRTGAYAKFSDEQMQVIRRKEQNLAAQIGQYGAMIHLDYPSSAVKDPQSTALRDDLIELLRATQPRVVYTHNLADKHDTHIGVAVATLQAMRALPLEQRPEAVYGCEVWRNLDWMPDAEKVVQDVSSHENLAAALNGVFDSQIAGGKRYDLGVLGRRRANATFFESHAVDRSDSTAFAMDLTPLVRDESLHIVSFVDGFVGRFRDEVVTKLQQRLGL
ncbi:MAG: PIG-L family deacetylase [Verrucomicrobiota bacterium]